MAIVGIDLGTTNSLISVYKDGECILIPNQFHKTLTPSVVSVDEEGKILVGQIARERLITHPKATAFSFKRLMGQKEVCCLGGKKYLPEELSAFVIRQLLADAQSYLGEPVEEAVISVPAYFTDEQRVATKRAGALAGIRVERIINEPSAAALWARFQQGMEDAVFLVFDFGGGTLDVSIVDSFENIIEILSVSGDNHLGGDDFQGLLSENFCAEHHLSADKLDPQSKALLQKQALLCKHKLTEQEEAQMSLHLHGSDYSSSYTCQKLLDISGPIFLRMQEVLRRAIVDSNYTLEEISQVIMVGGSSKMPVVQGYLEHLFGRRPIVDIRCDETVAKGCALAAAMKSREEGIKELLLTDICPFSIGTDVVNEQNPSEPLFEPVIERNSTLPCSKKKTFFTARDFQSFVKFNIYQGDSYYARDNRKLSELKISLPIRKQGTVPIEVRFTYDINGILQTEAFVPMTQKHVQKEVIPKDSYMSDTQIEARMKELEKLKSAPQDQAENKMLMARGERLYVECVQERREYVRRALTQFQWMLEHGSHRQQQEAQQQLKDTLDALESEDPFLYYYEEDGYEEDED
ncbi:Hsp70 family protein [Lactonifactor longoviformis]|uniref:Hsp70 family protein n=1 Tax=Lactonifactor longoviformis TaxID=341220 RepID=UPI0036F2D468